MPDLKPPCFIYTDGSVRDKTGGWGFIIQTYDKKITGFGGALNCTSNQMELMAAIMAFSCLGLVDPEGVILVTTDSKYLYNGASSYIYEWDRRNYKKSNNSTLCNVGFWVNIYESIKQFSPKWEWVRSHSGVLLNDEADCLAKHGRYEAARYLNGKKAGCTVHNFHGIGKQYSLDFNCLLVDGYFNIEIEELWNG